MRRSVAWLKPGELWKGIFTIQSAESQPKGYHGKGGVRAQVCLREDALSRAIPNPQTKEQESQKDLWARPSLGWIVMDNDTSFGWIVMPHRQQSPCVLSVPQDFLTQNAAHAQV